MFLILHKFIGAVPTYTGVILSLTAAISFVGVSVAVIP